jgi:hypothetical protein
VPHEAPLTPPVSPDDDRAGVHGAYLITAFDGAWLPSGIRTFGLAAITQATTAVTR